VQLRERVEEGLCERHAGRVRRDDHRPPKLALRVQVARGGGLARGGGKVAARREEAGDLLLVQVEREHAVDAHLLQQRRNVRRRDGNARRVLARLPPVRVVRQHCGDARGARAAQAGDDERELHEEAVDARAAQARHHVRVAQPHVAWQAEVRFAVGVLRVNGGGRNAEDAAYLVGEGLSASGGDEDNVGGLRHVV